MILNQVTTWCTERKSFHLLYLRRRSGNWNRPEFRWSFMWSLDCQESRRMICFKRFVTWQIWIRRLMASSCRWSISCSGYDFGKAWTEYGAGMYGSHAASKAPWQQCNKVIIIKSGQCDHGLKPYYEAVRPKLEASNTKERWTIQKGKAPSGKYGAFWTDRYMWANVWSPTWKRCSLSASSRLCCVRCWLSWMPSHINTWCWSPPL